MENKKLVIHDRLKDEILKIKLLSICTSRTLAKYIKKGYLPKSSELTIQLIKYLYIVDYQPKEFMAYQDELLSPVQKK